MISFLSLLFLELLAVATITVSFSNGSTYVGCIKSEREALLRFKHDLIDASNRLSSWVADQEDCCKWDAVVCSNFTGHVLELHLHNPVSIDFFDYSLSIADYEAYERSKLRGKISTSLLDLKHLVHLDLSRNDFVGLQIPRFLGSMRNLRYLNLSSAQFEGMIPHQLGNLSTLQYLDLSNHYYPTFYAESLSWLSGLSSLKHLDLGFVNLTVASDWLLDINKLSSLTVLLLKRCQLHHIPPLPFPNFTSSLTTLDLSENQFGNTSLSSWFFKLQNLEFFDLSVNNFKGPIPDGLMNLTSLRHLYLSFNYFNSSIPNGLSRLRSLETLDLRNNSNLQGTIPRSLGKLCSLKSFSFSKTNLNQDVSEIFHIFSGCVLDELKILDMHHCQLFGQLPDDQLGEAKNLEVLDIGDNFISGYVPSSLGELSSLQKLDLSNNKLNGTLSEIHFANLTRLTNFDASGNSLTLKVNHDWVPPFQLQTLILRSCVIGPQFPSWLHSQQNLTVLDISSSGIVDSVPSWFWRSLSQFIFLNVSYNQIQGEIPNLTGASLLWFLDLSSNNLSGPMPLITYPYLYTLDLSNNSLSGSIAQFLCHKTIEPRLTQVLKLGSNSFSGELPDCWMNWQYLSVLELSDNNFTGNLPFSIGNLSVLRSFHLRNNRFLGVIPQSLKNCTELVTLDMGENEFSGNIPAWIGERFSDLVILNLRSNKFHGRLPVEFCHLTSLQILDLAYNNLSGSIPSCIRNFSAMVSMDYSQGNSIQFTAYVYGNFTEEQSLVVKGILDKYNSILNLVRSIDLSKNSFSGEIPMEVTDLLALRSLNLSHNSFVGKIPESIGDMRELETLDFSVNLLSGKIPLSITSLTYLNHLNLSNNKLTGEIPLSTQLQSLGPLSFTGNELCGPPLPENCAGATVPTPNHEKGKGDKGSNEDEMIWFYVSMPIGFVVGFWCWIGPLLINRRWRYMYYRFLDRLRDKFYFGIRRLC
ncbi:hypothetical protein Ddye_027399 [Dipteronia dyeriana]|uniref:Leucine-rich repeat-containing N-terminal plant-type domain-containing protein n=1 Tax=Dipteronia dyeriana TaxID=168575 RepID=A0AAD9TPY1_9ROSI|nr:hypothetical protein Ddye_027399 [Dipteronia dyeriana]